VGERVGLVEGIIVEGEAVGFLEGLYDGTMVGMAVGG